MITQGTHKYYAPSFAENEEVRCQSILGSSALKCLTTLQYLCESVWQRLK